MVSTDTAAGDSSPVRLVATAAQFSAWSVLAFMTASSSALGRRTELKKRQTLGI
jgi:hypothetical protein